MKPTKEEIIKKYAYDGNSLVYAKDSGQGGKIKAGTVAGWIAGGARIVMLGGKKYQASHMIWCLVTGNWPSQYVKRRNGNRLDDRFENLELVDLQKTPKGLDVSLDRLNELFFYNPETGIFTRKKAQASKLNIGDKAGSLDCCGYLRCKVDGKTVLLHRAAWAIYYGEMPEMDIDHANGNRSDNRICNLRIATVSQNCQNAAIRKDSTTRVKGVSFHKKSKRYIAYINLDKKRKHLGYFNTIEDAKNARIEAEVKLHPYRAIGR